MPPPPHRPPPLVGAVFRGSSAVRDGLLTRHQLHSSAWQRLFPDVYACASLPLDHPRRARAVARLLLPGSVVSAQNVARDRRRLNELTAAGWIVVFVTAADLSDPVALVARIAAALAAPRYA